MEPPSQSATGARGTAPGSDRSAAGGPPDVGTERSYDYYRAALEDVALPAAFVDVERLETNARAIRKRAGDTRVRVASKSVRSRAVLDRILALDEGFEGLLCYSGEEAAYLADAGFSDLVVAYPIWQESEVEAACEAIEAGARVQLMVDSVDHVQRLSTLAEQFGQDIPLCLDIDLSTSHFGLHFGVRRSGVRDVDTARHVAATIADAPAVHLAGVMGYEAQLAGIPDDSPANNALVNAVIRLLKRRSRPTVRKRRQSIVRALARDGHDLEVTVQAVVDELAGAANLVMGEGDGGTPAVVVRDWSFGDHAGDDSLFRPVEEDYVREALRGWSYGDG